MCSSIMNILEDETHLDATVAIRIATKIEELIAVPECQYLCLILDLG